MSGIYNFKTSLVPSSVTQIKVIKMTWKKETQLCWKFMTSLNNKQAV